jgi:hypothetical protein
MGSFDTLLYWGIPLLCLPHPTTHTLTHTHTLFLIYAMTEALWNRSSAKYLETVRLKEKLAYQGFLKADPHFWGGDLIKHTGSRIAPCLIAMHTPCYQSWQGVEWQPPPLQCWWGRKAERRSSWQAAAASGR